MDTGKVLLGAFVGVVAGTALGVLFAPDKGCNTRKKIMNKGEDFVDDIKDKFDDLFDSLNQKFEALKNEADEIVASSKGKYEELKKDVKHTSA